MGTMYIVWIASWIIWAAVVYFIIKTNTQTEK